MIDYYVPYDIQESSKNRPTVTDEFPENAYLTEGYYECEYEATSDLWRCNQKTCNSSEDSQCSDDFITVKHRR